MVLFNYSAKELTAKVVYYGPGLCGKTTNLQVIYNALPQSVKGKMLSLSTKTDRTLFFDFLPLDLGNIAGMKTRIQLYTVPGQVFYNETRRLVLKGSDGIVFVADSQAHLLNANIESFKNLEDNLKTHGMSLKDMPLVLQFNKRDLPSLSSIDEMNLAINKYNAPFYESVATTGIGVQDTLRAITKLVLIHLSQKFDLKLPDKMKEKKEAEEQEAAQGEQIPQAVGVAQQQEQVSSSSEPIAEIPISSEPKLSSEASAMEEEPASQEETIPIDSLEEPKIGEEGLVTETSGWLPPEDQTEDQIPSMPDEMPPADTYQAEEVPSGESLSRQDSVEDRVKEEIPEEVAEEVTLEDTSVEESQEGEVTPQSLAEEPPTEEIKLEESQAADEEIKDESHEAIEGAVEFEIKEDALPSTTPETEKDAEVMSLSPGGMQEIRIPFLLETGEGKKQFHLKISLRLEESEK